MKKRDYLAHPLWDVWLVGGASLVIWMVMLAAQIFRSENQFVEQKLSQISATFALLAIVCNYPHFISSYRIAYGRGFQFIRQHFFSLIFVPLFMIAVFALAFFRFDFDHREWAGINTINAGFSFLPIEFRVGEQKNLGSEVVGLAIWFMYLSVGWHYSKQTYGAFLVFSKYRNYSLNKWQKIFLKLNVYSIAFYQLNVFSKLMGGYAESRPLAFFSAPMTNLGLHSWVNSLSLSLLVLSTLLFLVGVFGYNYVKQKTWPPLIGIVVWLAFAAWWVPIATQPEFYFVMVPFFHSLQYLPFAAQMEAHRHKDSSHFHLKMAAISLLVLITGVFAFDLIPYKLDLNFSTEETRIPFFFMICALVFINIHHFFIDSCVWHFSQDEVRNSLFNEVESR
jgi:hypothetical protein